MDGETLDLAHVADLTFKPYRSGDQSRIIATGPSVMLGREAATTLAPASTNWRQTHSTMALVGPWRSCWTRLDGIARRRAADYPVGRKRRPPVTAPSRTGYGTRYLTAALRNLFGSAPSIAYPPHGLEFAVSGLLSRPSLNPDPRNVLIDHDR